MNISCNTCNIVIASRKSSNEAILEAKAAHEATSGHYPNATHDSRVAVGKWGC